MALSFSCMCLTSCPGLTTQIQHILTLKAKHNFHFHQSLASSLKTCNDEIENNYMPKYGIYWFLNVQIVSFLKMIVSLMFYTILAQGTKESLDYCKCSLDCNRCPSTAHTNGSCYGCTSLINYHFSLACQLVMH